MVAQCIKDTEIYCHRLAELLDNSKKNKPTAISIHLYKKLSLRPAKQQ